MKACGKCRFAVLEGEQNYCHLLPPAVQVEPGVGVHFMFPAVTPKSWCSFFKLSLKKLFKGDGART